MPATDFRLVDRALLAEMLREPAKAAATCIVLKDTAAALQRRVIARAFYTKAELRRNRVAAATALAAVRALRLKDVDVLRAADALVCFLRDEPMAATSQVAA